MTRCRVILSRRVLARWTVACLALALCLPLQGCGDQDISKGLRRAVISLDLALHVADDARVSGFLQPADEQQILMIGDQVRLSLIQANDFARNHQQFTAGDKAQILALLDEGLARASALVNSGGVLTDAKARDQFNKYALPVQAALRTARKIAEAIKPRTP